MVKKSDQVFLVTKTKIKNFKNTSKNLNFLFEHVDLIFSAIKYKNGSLKIIGGNVRDLLNGEKMSSDTDLVTDLRIEDVIFCLKKKKIRFKETGLKFGCITAIIENNLIEITSLRSDVSTDGRRAKTMHINDWTLDAMRRDFTINSIYCDLKGRIFDPLNGINDLAKKKVVFIGNAEERIVEDNLRILRFLRFSLKYSNSFDKNGLKACEKLKLSLKNLSFERKNSELVKLICLEKFEKKIETIISTGILREIFECKINIKNIKKLFYIERKLSIVDAERRIKFFINRSRNTLIKKYPSKFRKSFLKRIKSKIKFLNYEQSSIKKKLFKFSEIEVVDQLLIDYVDKKISLKEIKKLMEFINTGISIRKPFSGDDFLNLGINDGLLIGKYIKKLENWWIKNDFKATKIECIEYIKKNLLPRS